jgi:DNA (cytosine-5)-methyltransferase 1
MKKGDRVIDLFCGAGGLSIGFEKAGYDVILAIDNMDAAVSHYNKNIEPVAKNIDISEMDKSELPDCEGIIGGPPCQGFSLAGKRDPNDERSSLVYDFVEAVEKKQPKFFLMENVTGLKSSEKQSALRELFNDAGYEIRVKELQADNFGVPQTRERLFFFGVREDLNKDMDQLDSVLNDLRRDGGSLKKALPNFEKPFFYRHPYSYGRRAVYPVEDPYPTVRTVHRPMPSTYEFHENDATEDPEKVRHLSEEELALIQTFPEDYEWEGTKKTIRTLIGNAVPTELGRSVAEVFQALPEKRTLEDY